MSNPIKSAEMAPVLQSMQDYICNHFTDELMDEVSSAVSLGLVEDLDIDAEGGKPVVQRNESKIIRTEFWRLDCTKLLADIKMRVKIGVSRDHGVPHYVVRYVNFSAQFTLDGGITLHQGIRELTTCCLPERKLPKLSKYLVPVLSYDEMEIMVLQLLRKYRGEQAVLTFQENGATALAQAMGLEIRRVSLYRNHHTAAILYPRERHARVVASGASGSATDDEPFQDMTIPAKTIVLNENRLRQGDIEREIYHECGHYEWHSMFFELQALHAADLRLLEYAEADKASKPAEKDIKWVERQASFVGIAAMFPRPIITPLVNRYWGEVANLQDNLGHKISSVIYRIASEKQKPKSLIKTRLITMGSVGAKGAFNFVDGKYIQPFAFHPDNLGPNDTFVISRSQFTEMYEQDSDFRDLIDTHQYIYADGHVCCNLPSFVRKADKGAALTAWALAHVDECCLRFRKSYHVSPQSGYQVGELHSDSDYNEVYLTIHTMEITGMPMEILMEKNMEYLDELPKRPSRALAKLIADRVGTQKELALNSGLSPATISRMCKDDDFRYTIQEVTRIIVGLQLPPPLSALFMDTIGFTRTVMVKYYRYQCIIDCMFMDDIYQIVETHHALFDQ